MRKRIAWVATVLALSAGSASAKGLLRPWDLMDLSGEGGSRVGVEIEFTNTDYDFIGDFQGFEFLFNAQFALGRTADLWVRMPFAFGEGATLFGNVGVGAIFNVYDKTTSSGGRLSMGVEAGLYLPTAQQPNDQDEGQLRLAIFLSRAVLIPRWAVDNFVVHGAYGIRFKTGRAFFMGDIGIDMAFETEDDNNDDDTHTAFHLAGGGGAEVARNIAILGELFYVDGDQGGDDNGFGINAGARFSAGPRLTLGASLQKSLDAPGNADLIGIRFDINGYF